MLYKPSCKLFSKASNWMPIVFIIFYPNKKNTNQHVYNLYLLNTMQCEKLDWEIFGGLDVFFGPVLHTLQCHGQKVMVSQRIMSLRYKIHMRSVFKQVVNNRRVSHGCDITDVLVILCNLPQNSAHDLARTSLWKPRWILNDTRSCKGSNFGTN